MKKIAMVAVVFAFALATVGCGGSSTTSSKAATTTTPSTK